MNHENHTFYLGSTIASYIGYSLDVKIREGAASGGVVSQLLLHLLKTGSIDGAIVSKLSIKNQELVASPILATSADEILSCRTSIYMDFDYYQCLKMIRSSKCKRIALVGLPCQINTISRLCAKDSILRETIFFKISLFCSHATTRELISNVIKKEKIELIEGSKFFFRTGHWRGFLTLIDKCGNKKLIPYLRFGLYMNLYFYEHPRCLSCTDHFGESSDLSIGDAWLKELKKNPIKHSMIVAKTEKGDAFMQDCQQSQIIYLKSISPTIVVKSQKRGLIRKKHYIYAFKQLAPFFGFHSTYIGPAHAKWNHYIGAFFILLNMKISKNTTFMKIIFRIPRPILYIYVGIIKFFMNF